MATWQCRETDQDVTQFASLLDMGQINAQSRIFRILEIQTVASDSAYLSFSDYRFIYLLVGECCELGAEPLAWRQHLLSRLNHQLGALASVIIEGSFDPSQGLSSARVEHAVSVNRYTPSENEILLRCVQSMKIEENPLGAIMLSRSYASGPLAARRGDFVSRTAWERSEFRCKYFMPLGWDSMLVAVSPRTPTNFQFMNFSRLEGEREFSARNGRLLQLMIKELSSISEARLAGNGEDSILALPNRERQVLIALTEGDEEKQIARRLGISRNTVHEYIRRLYKRFQVQSRSQLLLLAARKLHALEVLSSDMQLPAWHYRRASQKRI